MATEPEGGGPLRTRLLRLAAKTAIGALDRLEDALEKGPATSAPVEPRVDFVGPDIEGDGGGTAGGMPHPATPAGPAEIVKHVAPIDTGIREMSLEKAQGSMPGAPDGDPEAIYWDPFALVEQLGYKDKPSTVTYGTLQAMVWRLPILRAIIKTRVDQVANFCQPQMPPHEPGFRVRLREANRTPTPAELKKMQELETFMMTTGTVIEDRRERQGLEYLIRQIVQDTLMYDQLNLEIVPDHKGRPSQWYAVDPATIRFVDSASLAPDHSMTKPYCVQIYDNVVVAEFTRNQMVFGVRNPRSDIRSHGYGTSEAEMMIQTITYLLWGMEYNGRQFSQGSIAKGLLNIKGAIPEKQLRAFRRQWYQLVAGVENAWRTPIVNAEDLQWINMHASNRDMEFSDWMDFLIKVTCSVFGMDPIEVNFKYGGGGKAMFESASKVKITESKAKGLAPLLRFIGKIFNENIIWPLYPDFSFEFTGLSPMTPKEQADLETQKVRTYMMVDEVRAAHDLPALPEGLGQVINDPNWMQARRDLMLQQQLGSGDAQAQATEEAQAETPAPTGGDSGAPDPAAGVQGAAPPPIQGEAVGKSTSDTRIIEITL